MYKKRGKRILDLVVSLTALILLSPLLIVLAITCAVAHKGTPFFLQQRPGYRENIFRIIKFKTMLDRMDQHGQLLPDDQRTTALGRFLRTYALDELPQLWNVVVGEMSLIGPRPLLPEYLPIYAALHRKRHDVLPGITGWAQIHGRNTLAWDNKLALDIWYVDNLSFAVDFHIFRITLASIWTSQLTRPAAVLPPKKFKG
jgi:undecaprenyl phosphate N,N'-diacetylbacillosamine 1-phosphate transferase